ncbi:glycosyltransferase [Gluconobacter morbifer]|uniref:Lipopolysaccharide core biosynthesis glycosyl transferase n=1 Tax=Gluconobacter morbifer G707 TaxID=1088869 RepID=G6XF75_9PROT|nr:glycosyltransferase [Gluconobacter morbifer]EHH68833.1 lipopolysaccharide core biosynthesis glycosyl transferase [Gluconobacter morbifer G707]
MTDSLRILHCLSTHELAGTERHVAELSAAQTDRHDVTLLLDNNTTDPCTGSDIITLLSPKVKVVRAGRKGFLFRLAQLAHSGAFDVIHTHLGRASARATWLRKAGLAGNVALVATLHTSYRNQCYGGHDGLICIAGWQQKTLPSDRRDRSALIANWTVPSGLSPDERAVQRRKVREEWGVAPGTFLFGSAGRMVPEKRFDLLLDAWQKAGFGSDVALAMVGDGTERAGLERLAAGDSRIFFPGFRTDMPAVLSALDGFVLPSRHEPFGLVLLEAMDAGLPVCATDAGGVPDILKNSPSSMVRPDCLPSLTEGLRHLHEQSRCVWDLTAFSLSAMLPKVEAFYRQCLRSRS